MENIKQEWPFNAKWTDAELENRKRESTAWIMQNCRPEHPTPSTVFTCAECVDRHCCDLAFDPYNTEGDCLAVK